MRLSILGLVSLLSLALTRPALADLPGDEVESYRSHTLTVDALSFGLMAGGGLLEGPGGDDSSLTEGMMGGGLLGGVVGVPLTHALHGNSGRAVASLALRVGFLNAGLYLAMKSTEGCDELLCGLENLGLGMVGGLAVAAILDNALFPHRTVARKAPDRVLSPQVSASRGGGTVGIAGTF